jgi:gliding motility-associated lipoprotein GldH
MNRIILSLLIICTVLLSCKRNRIYEKNRHLSPNIEWIRSKKLIYEVNIQDNTTLYNQSFALRYITGYPYKNLYIHTTRIAPSGKTTDTTYVIEAIDNNKKYKGDGLGDYWDYEQLVDKNICFPETGTYRFIVEQAMPMDTIAFVMELGLAIDKVASK